MIYLYAYYTIVFLFIGVLGYTSYKAGSWQARVVLGGAAVFSAATATMLGLLHTWTSEGFGYFAAILRGLGVAI